MFSYISPISALRVVTIFFFLFAANTAVFSQNSPGTAPGTPAGSYPLSEIDTINYFSGRMSVSIPLYDIKGRGETSFPVKLHLDQTRWQMKEIPHPLGWESYKWLERKTFYGEVDNVIEDVGIMNIRLVQPTLGTNVCEPSGYVRAVTTLSYLVFTAPEGTAYTLYDTHHGGRPNSPDACSAYAGNHHDRGTEFVTWDGTGATFISDEPIYDYVWPDGPALGPPPSGILRLRDGRAYRFDEGGLTWIEDRNGNKITRNGLAYVDSLGREYPIAYKYDSAGSGSTTYSLKGTGGAQRSIIVTGGQLEDSLIDGATIKSCAQLFPNFYTSYPEWLCSEYNPKVTSGVILPNGQEYRILYNSYGDIARIELPTGGAIEYDWSSASCFGGDPFSCSELFGRVIERRVYGDGTNLTHRMTIGHVWSPYATNSDVTVDQFDELQRLSRTKHYFYGIPDNSVSGPGTYFYSSWKEGKEYKTQTFAGNGTTLLRTSNRAWAQGGTISWYTGAADGSPPKNPRIIETTTELNDVSPKLIAKTVYDYDQYNNTIDTWEYDYGENAPGAFLRRTHTDYVTDSNYTSYSGSHLRSLPFQTWVSSDLAGDNKVSRQIFEYDNYSSDSTHASLVSRSSVTGHDSTNFGTGFSRRGNMTGSTRYANAESQTGGVSTYVQYDILGNVVKTIDAKANATTISYNDNFGTADDSATTNTTPSQISGLNTFAYPTSTTNVLNWTAYVQYDYFTGKPVNTQDINGVISKTIHNDSLDRPTQTVSAIGTANEIQSSIEYDDENNRVESTSDLNTLNDNLLKSESFYDGLGRTYESRSYKDGDYVAVKTEYDALGRVKQVTNPYRPLRSETTIWTKSKYDALSRTTEVETPDGAKLYKSYAGPATTVTDQAGKKRKGVSDAFGRTTSVTEDPDGQNLQTSYVFDVLGNLRKTIQGEQSRYFMYNDLGRLLFAKQPEQDTNSNFTSTDPVTSNTNWSVKYEYDNNGNITKTTDARGIFIEGTYDDLNRLTVRNYSDSTPDVSFYFDGTGLGSVPNYSKGKTTKITSSVSETRNTSFDEMGHLLTSEQRTDGEIYPFEYTYNLSGALIEEKYPSGRVVKNTLNSDGELTQVQSKKNATQGFFTYANSFAYNAAGAVTKMQLGNGRWETATYDTERLQVTQIGLGVTDSTQNLLKLEFKYNTPSTADNNGSMREQKITVPTVGNNPGFTATQTYTYDDLNRLESATETISSSQTWKQTFSLDRYGNRRFNTSGSNTTTLGSCSEAICNPTISTSNNRLTSSGYDYDENGALIENAAGERFGYDAENHQTKFFASTNSGSTPDATYHYDGEGKRVKKIVSDEVTVFVYDASGQLVAEYATQIETTEAEVSYLTTDHLGSPRIITDETGAITSRKDFAPFGEETAGSDRTSHGEYGEPNIRQDYTSYEKDDESGLEYAQARYYSSGHGRFTSVDPLTASVSIRNPQTFNRYSYALNSPYKFTDPLGLLPCIIPGGGNTECIREADYEEKKLIDAPTPSGDKKAPGTVLEPTCKGGCRQPLEVFEPTIVFVTSGLVQTETQAGGTAIPNQPGGVPTDQAVTNVFFLHKWNIDFSFRIEGGSGSELNDYEYEVDYDFLSTNDTGVTGRQAPINGQADLGRFAVQPRRIDPQNPNPDRSLADDNEFQRSGTITIYGSYGRIATTRFEINIVGSKLAQVEPPQAPLKWNRPSN